MKKLPFALPSFKSDKLKNLIPKSLPRFKLPSLGKGASPAKMPSLDKKGFPKKLVIILAALLVIAGLAACGTYYWTGIKIEKQYREFIGRFSQYYGPEFKYSIDYDRGIFFSTAKTTFAVPLSALPPLQGEKIRSTQHEKISHGPFPLAGAARGGSLLPSAMLAYIESTAVLDTKIGLPEAIDAIYSEIAGLLTTSSRTRFNFDRSVQTSITNPAANKKLTINGKELEINWSGISGQSTISPDMQISGTAESPGLAMSFPEFSCKLTDIKSTVNLSPWSPGLAMGDISLSIGDINMHGQQDNAAKALSLTGLSITNKTSESGGSISSASTLSLSGFTVENTAYGPFHVEMELRNIDAGAVAKLQQAATAMQTAETGDEQQLAMQLFGDLSATLAELVKKSPELEFKNLSITTPDGDLSGSAKIAIDGSAGEIPLTNPDMLLSIFSAQAEIEVAERLLAKSAKSAVKTQLTSSREKNGLPPLPAGELDVQAARQSRKQLQDLVSQQMLVKEGELFRVGIQYEKGMVTVNGRPMPVQNFLGQ